MKKMFAIAVLSSMFAANAFAARTGEVSPGTEKPTYVSACWVKDKRYDCGSNKVVVFRASGTLACRPPKAPAEPGEEPCTNQEPQLQAELSAGDAKE